MDLFYWIYDCFLDLPHASIPTGPQNPVSVIIRCKTVKTEVVENTVASPRLGQMRSHVPGAACCGTWWGYLTVHFAVPGVHILATLRRFDSKLPTMGQNGPLIPWERRLTEMEIPENQEVTFAARFGNRD